MKPYWVVTIQTVNYEEFTTEVEQITASSLADATNFATRGMGGADILIFETAPVFSRLINGL